MDQLKILRWLYETCVTAYIRGMEFRSPLSVDEELRMLVESRAQEAGPRIERMEADGQVFWIKRPEKLNLRYRLQKGDPRKAFDRERRAFADLIKAGAPVPSVTAEGPDYIVLPDCGLNLRILLAQEPLESRRDDMLFNAIRTLAAFHKLGFAHGRPSPKDMCLVDDQILLLDFERYRRRNNTAKGQSRDLIIFAFNVAAHSPQMRAVLPEMLAIYRERSAAENWHLAQQLCRRMRWMDWATKPIQMRPGNKAQEFKVIPLILDLFANPI